MQPRSSERKATNSIGGSKAVEIRKRAPKTVNRDEGAYQLSHTWDTAIPPHQVGWKRCKYDLPLQLCSPTRLREGSKFGLKKK
ncbi:hypothetical protein AALO_G00093590 [Alosa alosa]|uniref:Uncharacterized protein n=1 Tax=Alosa alosa TaxID=278164 RepID=A0AAV6GW86_9TELE|nr:hypothetical protein AALO_G00093590 [Alosa alosa]